MFTDAITKKVAEHFPDVKILTKDQSLLMKILGLILFFNPSFMTDYITTIGYNIYFPSEAWVNARQVSGLSVLLHELIHVTDAKKLSRPLFSFLYLSPLTLAIPAALLFLLTWKIALPIMLLCLAPIPSYFRMLFEKRAYLGSLYVQNWLNVHKGYNFDLSSQKDFMIKQFTGSAYYFMWPFTNLNAEFDDAITKIKAGQRPYDNSAFDVLDDILTAA